MKKVFRTSAEVIRLFATNEQSEARTSNVFLSNSKLYSYGYHYLLAQRITNPTGEVAIMINDTGYSATTAKHICEVKMFTRSSKRFFTMQSEAKKVYFTLNFLYEKYLKARKKELYYIPAKELYSEYKKYVLWYGVENDTYFSEKIETIIKKF